MKILSSTLAYPEIEFNYSETACLGTHTCTKLNEYKTYVKRMGKLFLTYFGVTYSLASLASLAFLTFDELMNSDLNLRISCLEVYLLLEARYNETR